jgi:lysophospholipid acyltransferase (LPLAT)-like uncharacterized protein
MTGCRPEALPTVTTRSCAFSNREKTWERETTPPPFAVVISGFPTFLKKQNGKEQTLQKDLML